MQGIGEATAAFRKHKYISLAFGSDRHGDVVRQTLSETTAAVERLTAWAVTETRRSR